MPLLTSKLLGFNVVVHFTPVVFTCSVHLYMLRCFRSFASTYYFALIPGLKSRFRDGLATLFWKWNVLVSSRSRALTPRFTSSFFNDRSSLKLVPVIG